MVNSCTFSLHFAGFCLSCGVGFVALLRLFVCFFLSTFRLSLLHVTPLLLDRRLSPLAINVGPTMRKPVGLM